MNPHRSITRRKLDERLAALGVRVGPRPLQGWVRTLRDALGMSASELAARMKVTQSRVSQIERAEVSGSIQLSTLTRAAEALECQLVYAIVPVRSLDEMVMRRSWLKAGWALDDSLSYDGSNLEEIVEGPETLERHEVLALEWVDRRGLWTDAAVQLAARVVPLPPDPPPASRSGAP